MKMKLNIFFTLLFVTLSTLALANTEEEVVIEEQDYAAWAEGIWNSLDRKTDKIQIPKAGAVLNVPDDFYFLNSQDAEKVLVEVWGNPPSESTLGMLFPANKTPFDEDSWAVTIEYEEDGYVPDEDADDIDYDGLLSQMKEETQMASEERKKLGYESIELVGWAANPFYDTESHKLHWAKELKFEGQDVNTLNYNIRVLGRKGVLVLNFIAGIDQKELIESKLASVLEIAEFDQGSTYSDFDPEIDKVAAYGLGALVAGKVMVKTGLLAGALLFFKKFFVLFIIGIGIGIGIFIKKFFSRNKSNETAE